MLTAHPHASLEGLELSAYALLSSSCSAGQSPADLVKENKTISQYSQEQGKPVQSKREFCNLFSAAGKLLFINQSKKMLKIIGKIT